MISLHTKNPKNKKKIIWGVIIALLFVVAFFKDRIGHTIAIPVISMSQSFLSTNQSLDGWIDGRVAYFKQKRSLDEENRRLRGKLAELEAKDQTHKNIEAENNELREALSRTSGNNKRYIVAAVLKRPPEIPYDSAIIDAGEAEGVKIGMMVTSYGQVLIGHIAEVFENTSKVKFISFPGDETNVILGGSGIATSAKGKGGENLEISLPREMAINTGEAITTPGLGGLIVGAVEKIDSDPSNPFQKILFRLPANIQQLKYVMIEK